jgi:hypothetical protein
MVNSTFNIGSRAPGPQVAPGLAAPQPLGSSPLRAPAAGPRPAARAEACDSYVPFRVQGYRAEGGQPLIILPRPAPLQAVPLPPPPPKFGWTEPHEVQLTRGATEVSKAEQPPDGCSGGSRRSRSSAERPRRDRRNWLDSQPLPGFSITFAGARTMVGKMARQETPLSEAQRQRKRALEGALKIAREAWRKNAGVGKGVRQDRERAQGQRSVLVLESATPRAARAVASQFDLAKSDA